MLHPVDAGTTRLLTRMRVTYQPTAKWGPYAHLLLEPAHFVMGRRQLLGLRQRAEATSGAASRLIRGQGGSRPYRSGKHQLRFWKELG